MVEEVVVDQAVEADQVVGVDQVVVWVQKVVVGPWVEEVPLVEEVRSVEAVRLVEDRVKSLTRYRNCFAHFEQNPYSHRVVRSNGVELLYCGGCFLGHGTSLDL